MTDSNTAALQTRFGVSQSTLKYIAILTMLTDHTGATVIRAVQRLPSVSGDEQLRALWQTVYTTSRSIGRLAFPIFCFFIVQGFLHTRSVKKYAARLFIFALISEIPFDLALKGSWYYPQKQNVYFTLLIGLLVVAAIDRLTRHLTRYLPLAAIPIAAGMWLAYFIDTDYNFKGVFLIAVLYLTCGSRLLQCVTGMVSIAWEMPAPLSFLLIYFYNGTKGRGRKYFFYLFYPVHLMILYGIATYLIPALC